MGLMAGMMERNNHTVSDSQFPLAPVSPPFLASTTLIELAVKSLPVYVFGKNDPRVPAFTHNPLNFKRPRRVSFNFFPLVRAGS